MHALSHGAVSPAGTTFWNTEFQSFPTAAYSRNEKTCGTLPLAEGVGKEKQTSFHKLFYPMHSVLVFDDLVQRETLGEPSLIIVCGERCRGETLRLVGEYAKKGTRVVVPAWLGENCAEECVRISDFVPAAFTRRSADFWGCGRMDGFFQKSSSENYEPRRRREYFEFRFGGEKVKRVASEGAQKRGWATELRRGFKKVINCT